MNRYEKILGRKDKRRPRFFEEIAKNDSEHWGKALVLRIKVLLPDGTTLEETWSEQMANDMQRTEKQKWNTTS